MDRTGHSNTESSFSPTAVTPLLPGLGKMVRQTGAPVVYIGDFEARRHIEAMRAVGWNSRPVDAIDRLATGPETMVPTCLLLDVTSHNLDRPRLVEMLAVLRPEIPVICTVRNLDLGMAVRRIRAGAFDVVAKPLDAHSLLEAIGVALHHSSRMLRRGSELCELRRRYAQLSHRERQVMKRIASGLLNKQVAHELTISEITVKAHRGNVMRKMQARSFAALVRMVTILEDQDMRADVFPPFRNTA